MIDELSLYSVLVIEDEYYIADDLVRALRASGLAIVGPVANPMAALAVIDRQPVDFAVVDINLDGSISFEIAAALKKRDIPFIFLTGYDASVVPDAFGDIVLLQKPYEDRAVLAEIAHHRSIVRIAQQ